MRICSRLLNLHVVKSILKNRFHNVEIEETRANAQSVHVITFEVTGADIYRRHGRRSTDALWTSRTLISLVQAQAIKKNNAMSNSSRLGFTLSLHA